MPMGEEQKFGNIRKPLKPWETKKAERQTNYNKNVVLQNQQVKKGRTSINPKNKPLVYQIENKLKALNSVQNSNHLLKMIYNTEKELLELLKNVQNTRRLKNFNKMKHLDEFKNLQARMLVCCELGNRLGIRYPRQIINIEKIDGKQTNKIFEGKMNIEVTNGHRDGLDYVTVVHRGKN